MAGAIRSGEPGREFGGVSIDTRTLAAGELFIAIAANSSTARTSRIGQSLVAPPESSCQSDGDAETVSAAVVIEVADTTAALQALARAVRRASGTKVVAITGSAGKTTTKEVTGNFWQRDTRSFATGGI